MNTLESLARLIADLNAQLLGLQQENAVLGQENAELHQRISVLDPDPSSPSE